jgi:GNAT superfamily N-acetyltransferase
MEIKRVSDNDRIDEFINSEFSNYASDCGVALNYEDFCFIAEDDGEIAGVIVGRAYYNEVHIGDLIVGKDYRRAGIGSRLVAAVEDAYKGKGYEKIALTTFGFQAPEFYKKLGYELEFVREDKDPKLSKYFYLKQLGDYLRNEKVSDRILTGVQQINLHETDSREESSIRRIREMEEILDKATAALEAPDLTREGYEALQEEIRRLEAYYTGDQWKQDYDRDRAGRLPADLKRGVLSEDAVYDLLERNREIGEEMK